MDYEWDKNKAASNQRKHGIDFADAVSVFADVRQLRLWTIILMRSGLSSLAWMSSVAS